MSYPAVILTLALFCLLPALAGLNARGIRPVRAQAAPAARPAVTLAPAAGVETPGNLLRNPRFQDDWLTFLPETKNHHWAYPSEFTNRRDFNPDGWFCKGSWAWLD